MFTIFLFALGCQEKSLEDSEKVKLKQIKDENISKAKKAVEMQFTDDKNVKRGFELRICTEIQNKIDELPPSKGVFELQQQKNKIVEQVAKKHFISTSQVESIWKKFSGESVYDSSITDEDVEKEMARMEKEKKTCPENMVFVGLFCIDKFEYPNILGAMPEAGVSWYKAQAKCAEKGKSLCTEFEWITACEGFNHFAYPYANDYIYGKCRAGVIWEEGPAKSGDYPDCVSGYGAFDMSGNLAEWTGASDAQAVVRGGTWENQAAFVRCESILRLSPGREYKYLGFRCCAKPE